MAEIHWIYSVSSRRERELKEGAAAFAEDRKTSGFTQGGFVLTSGKELFAEGGSEDAVYKVEDGRVGLHRKDRLLAVLGSGAIVGAAAVLLQKPQLYSVRFYPSGSPVTVLSKYDGHALRNAFSQDPDEEQRAALGDLIEVVAGALDLELAAIENGILEGTSDPRDRIGRARAFARGRAERVIERLQQTGPA